MYFHGTRLNEPVKRCQASSFKELVDRYIDVCVSINCTREYFMALEKTDRDRTKEVSYLIPAEMNRDPSPRKYENALRCNLIFLDLDVEKDGSLPAAPFVGNPEALLAHLGDLSFAAYTTASHLPLFPRMRVIVDARAIPVESYPAAVSTIAARLGIPKTNRESRVAVQPMFLPSIFADEDPMFNHPVLISRTDGQPFLPADIAADIAADAPQRQAAPDTSLEFLRNPLEEITLEIVEDALSILDPDCIYMEWLDVAACLRHQFPSDSEAAYTLFDSWSAKGKKYASDEDTRAKWDSLRHTPAGRAPKTVRTLMRRAVEAGWKSQTAKSVCYNAAKRWIASAKSIADLMGEGLQRIASVPMLVQSEEDALLSLAMKHAKDKFGDTLALATLRKDLYKVKRRAAEAEKPKQKEAVILRQPWARGLVFVSSAGEIYRQSNGERLKTENFNKTYGRHLLWNERQLREANIPVNPSTLSKPVIEPADMVLHKWQIPVADDYDYNPASATDLWFFDQSTKKIYVNTYTRSYPNPVADEASYAASVFQGHLSVLIAEPQYRQTITDFLAYLAQQPGSKIRWSPVIQGAEGCGKSVLSDTMKVVLGAQHVKVIDGTAIKRGWNEWCVGSQLIAMEEVRIVGQNRHDVMNTLKPLITNDCIPVNERHKNTRQARNRTNYILFTNHHDALALNEGDRRYFIVNSPIQTKAQVMRMGEHEYFDPIYAMLRDYPGGIRHFFENWEISSSFNPDASAPRTKYLSQMIDAAAPEHAAAIRKAIAEGDNPLVQADVLSSSVLKQLVEMSVHGSRVTGQMIANVLRDDGYIYCERMRIGDERHYVWKHYNAHYVVNPAEILNERLAGGMRNLNMEMLL